MKQRNILVIVALFTFSLTRMAHARPEYLDVLLNHYQAYSGPLTERSCANCHVSTSDFHLNPFGKQIAHELVAANTTTLTPSILQKVEPLDSTGNDMSNLEKIKAGKAPEAPVAGAKPATTTGAEGQEEEAPAPAKKTLLPKNAFHPAIVHFPIALFIAGLFLDLAGYVRKKPSLLLAGWYNLVLAAVTAFAALASGYTATLRMHVPLSGLIRQHMWLALAGTAIMWVMVGLRVRRHDKMSVRLRVLYYAAAVAGLLLIAYAGHVGGQFVYGE